MLSCKTRCQPARPIYDLFMGEMGGTQPGGRALWSSPRIRTKPGAKGLWKEKTGQHRLSMHILDNGSQRVGSADSLFLRELYCLMGDLNFFTPVSEA